MISRVLIGWELWSIQVQTMKIMWWWYKFSFWMHDFPIGVKENGHKKMSTAMLLKKQITSHYPWSILLKRLLKWHQNVQNFAAKPFTCSSTVDKSTVWPWKTVDGLLNHVEMYSTSQREVIVLYIHWKEICPGDIDSQLLNTWPWLFKCWIAWTLSTA